MKLTFNDNERVKMHKKLLFIYYLLFNSFTFSQTSYSKLDWATYIINDSVSTENNKHDEFYSTVKSISENLSIKVQGDIQFDSRFYLDNPDAPVNNFLLRRVRVDFRGNYLKNFEFRLMPNFAGSTLEIQDAYIVINFHPLIKLRAGKYKIPVSLERIQNPTKTIAIELGLVNNLVPNRDIGYEISGGMANGILNYYFVINNGVIDGRSEDVETDKYKEFSGRIFLNPFTLNKESFLNKMGLGVAVTSGIQRGNFSSPRLASYRTAAQNNFFNFRDSVVADGNRIRIVPQAYFYSGRLGFLGEYVINKQKIKRIIPTEKITNTAFHAAFSFLLTDDEASFNGVKPKNEFDPANDKWGAFEVIFRYNKLTIDDNTFPIFSNPNNWAEIAEGWAAGIRWYFNEIFSLAINYERTLFSNSKANNFSLIDESVILTRLQAAF